jgi:hypothetical protein
MTTAFKLGRGIIGALLLAVALSGCSTLKLGYGSLPEISYLWLDRYFGFTDDQRPMVREALTQLHDWHRAEELPRIARTLHRLEQLAPGDISADQACTAYGEVRGWMQALAQRAGPSVTRVALALGPQQLAQLERRNERQADEFHDEWVRPSAAERLERRVKQVEGHAARLYGRLEPAQRALLRERLQTSIFDPARILAERRRRQADTQQTLRQLRAPGTDAAQANALVHALLERVHAPPDEAWRRYQQALAQEHCSLAAALHNAASPAQRQGAAERLRGWRRELGELAAAS